MVFHKRLKELRIQTGLSQKEFAEKWGIDTSKYNKWENGKNSPDFDTLCLLAKNLNVTTDYLLGVSKDKNPDELKTKQKMLEELIKYRDFKHFTIYIEQLSSLLKELTQIEKLTDEITREQLDIYAGASLIIGTLIEMTQLVNIEDEKIVGMKAFDDFKEVATDLLVQYNVLQKFSRGYAQSLSKLLLAKAQVVLDDKDFKMLEQLIDVLFSLELASEKMGVDLYAKESE